jgi:hypothetical protein
MFLSSFVPRWMKGKAFAPQHSRHVATRSARRRIRLRLEALEDRSVPSTVTNLSDHDPGSLRDAIATTPAEGTVDFQSGLAGTIMLTSGELAINKNLTIAGPGSSVITVSGNHTSRVLQVGSTFTVDISGLTIADGMAIGEVGGGVLNADTLTLTDSTLTGNATRFDGGAIFNGGTVALIDSTLSGNSAGTPGGAISNSGTVTIIRSTLSGNRSGASGGAIFQSQPGITLTMIDSTLSGNSAADFGGGIDNNVDATVALTSCTLSGNSATLAGGIYSDSGTVTTKNMILAGNIAPTSADLFATLTSQGHNLIGDGTGGGGFVATDLVGTAANPIDPKLGPLQNNGGPTQTMALLPGSPAIGAGDPTGAPPFD